MKKVIFFVFNFLQTGSQYMIILMFMLLQSLLLSAQKPSLPTGIVPGGLGYNIHFTDARPGELDMLARSGATIVRMDFSWDRTERQQGVYNFSAYERLTDSLDSRGISALYILDYSNRLYDENLSPCTPEGRAAFAKWATAAALHFKNRGIIWEMYNEPNIHFWKPEPNADDYILLALEVGKALRREAPDELYIGPATSEIDFDFLEKCFKAGLLEYWDAVSVHPYRQQPPETVINEYSKLRRLIDRYAPKDKHIPILSAEWGYSSAWGRYNDEIQGKMLPRQWLVNLACNIPVSIWYDWHDDGRDPKEPEHHFGTTKYEYRKDSLPVYDPKPSYLSALAFNDTFSGYKYSRRLDLDNDEVYVFLFVNGNNVRIAAWTTEKEPQTIVIPCNRGTFRVVSCQGEKLPDGSADENGLTITVTDAPVYLIPSTPNDALLNIDKYRVYPALPLTLNLPAIERNELVIRIDNMGNEDFSGQLLVTSVTGLDLIADKPAVVNLKKDDFETAIRFPFKQMPADTYSLSFSLISDDNRVRYDMPLKRYCFLDNFTKYNTETLNENWRVIPDGDAKVESTQKIEPLENGVIRVTYQFGDGWKFLRLTPRNQLLSTIEGKPQSLVASIDADGSGNSVRIRYRDSSGQTFQVDGDKMNIKGMQYFTFNLTGKKTAFWGGAEDGVAHYPIMFDSLIIDSTRKACGPLSIDVFQFVLVYNN